MMRLVRDWLNAPQVTNLQALIVAGVFLAISFIVSLAIGRIADLDAVHQAALVGVLVLLLVAVAVGFRLQAARRQRVASRFNERYSEHLWDAFNNLQKSLFGLYDISIGDYIKEGLLEPANTMLGDDRHGELRFSVLAPTDEDQENFRMMVALNHSPDSVRRFRLSIADSFAGRAYRRGSVQHSNNLAEDARWTPHPKARSGREYCSMIAVPIREGDGVEAVFCVVSTEKDAFTEEDLAYLTLLGGIMEVVAKLGKTRSSDDQTPGSEES